MGVTDLAIDGIRRMIIDGELRPGDRLPREPDLAKRLGLSRSSLREAVRALSLVNVLDVRQGDGTYVTSLEPGLLLSALDFVVDLHQDDTVLHLFQVRLILEPAATALAATHMTRDEVEGLRRHLDALPSDPGVDELVEHDLRFHHLIARGSGNPVLCSFIDSLSAPTQRARVWRGITQTGALERTVREHRAILDAVAAHQPDVARASALLHVSGIEQWLRSAAQETREPAPSSRDAIE